MGGRYFELGGVMDIPGRAMFVDALGKRLGPPVFSIVFVVVILAFLGGVIVGAVRGYEYLRSEFTPTRHSEFTPARHDDAQPAQAPSPPASVQSAASSAPHSAAAAYGVLNRWQMDILEHSIPQYSKIVIARPQMTEPQNFAMAFQIIFRTLGIEPIQIEQNPNARDQTGVRIGVVDINKPPSADALRMQDVIRKMGFEGDFIQLRGEALVAAEVNNGFAIYVGPRPLN
jgi:hypothetical protein